MQPSYIIISLCWLLSLRRHLRIHLDTKIFEAFWSKSISRSFTKCIKVCVANDHDIETQRKRREFCMSLDLDSHFINSHRKRMDSDGLWWTLKKSALCQGMGMPLWKRFGIHTSAQGSQGNVRKQSRKQSRKQHLLQEPNSSVNHSTPAAVIRCDI